MILQRLNCIALGLTTLAGALLVSANAHAYYSTIDTGDIIDQGKYQISLEPQFIFNRYPGVNAVGRFDTNISEDSSARGILGFGKVDFQVGGMYKWVPFPDTANQPAVGLEAGAILARVDGNSEFNLRAHPLISKRLETEIGDVTPYAALPLGIAFRHDETVIPLQLVGGVEIRTLNMPALSYFAEIGVNLNEAFGYISFAIAYTFNESATHRSSN